MIRMHSTPTRKFRCLHCHKKLDSATAHDFSAAQPKPGDASICVDCGHLMVFGNDMWPRNPTREEQIAMAGDETILATQKMLAEYKQWRAANGG